MAIRVYDTLRAEKVPFVTREPGRVRMYVCGMTVQDVPHVGHLRSSIVGDTIRRFLEWQGYEVTFVYNFTDVDDKIIAKANEEGVDYREVSRRNEELFLRYARALNIKPATHYPRATEHIAEIVEMIRGLIARGKAYAAGNGDVYYRVRSFPEYGKLSKKRIDDLRSGARIDVGEDKEDPLDFALWKGAKPGEPSWESPWGAGRPGWHIECSAMSRKYCGETLDLHGGGEDLIFPHHENEIAQSEGVSGKPFVTCWVHNGWVTLGGDKMSKSTRKFRPIDDVVAAFHPEAVRLYLMGTHYRSPIEFSEDRLRESETAFQRLAGPLVETARRPATEAAHPREADIARGVDTAATAFLEGMSDDFNTARAVAALFDLSRLLNGALDEAPEAAGPAVRGGAARLRALGEVLGLFWLPLDAETTVPEEIAAMVREREAARGARDWKRADALRAQLAAAGWTLEDRADGTRIRREG
jgi:cysteinyl-tRNA synthetase